MVVNLIYFEDSMATESKNILSTDYILYSGKNRAIWRPNPADPYIYVSFSLQQFKETYGNEAVVKYALFAPYKISAVPRKKQHYFIQALEREIIDRAGFPVKLLPADAKNIKEKDVCFIIQKAVAQTAIRDGQISVTTLHLRENENPNDNVTPAQYKVIILNDLNPVPTAKDIFTFLHEFLHVMEFKHFKQYNPNVDIGPFTEDLTCLDTLMAYDEYCPPVKKAELEIFGSRTVSLFSKNPQDRADMKAFENSYPVTLGSLDLAAAAVFNERWANRNKAPQPIASQAAPTKTTGRVKTDLLRIPICLGNCVESTSNFVYQAVDKGLTYFTNAAIRYSQTLAKECPSYFPQHSLDYPADPGYSSSISTLNATALTLTAPTPALPLNCMLGIDC